MYFVALFESPQDGDGVLNRGLIDKDLLEAALQCRVLLNVLAVLIKGGCSNAAQFTAGQHRFEQVAGIHRSARGACPNDGVDLRQSRRPCRVR